MFVEREKHSVITQLFPSLYNYSKIPRGTLTTPPGSYSLHSQLNLHNPMSVSSPRKIVSHWLTTLLPQKYVNQTIWMSWFVETIKVYRRIFSRLCTMHFTHEKITCIINLHVLSIQTCIYIVTMFTSIS